MSKKQENRWFYMLPGEAYAYGPTSPMTKEDLKQYIRDEWSDNNRIPNGTQYWIA